MKTAYEAGRDARKNGQTKDTNPFDQIERFTKLGTPVYANAEDRRQWDCGFEDESARQYKLNGGKPATNPLASYKRKSNRYYGQ